MITRVLANAGSGKTYKLSSDFLCIAHGGIVEGDPSRVESILATTFTRASARDIRNTVLLRAAVAVLDNDARSALAESILFDRRRANDVRAEDLLDSLVERLDRLEIRTIDSFLNRLACAYSLELGIPAGTTPISEPAVERIHLEALARVIESDPAQSRLLLQSSARGKGKRDLGRGALKSAGKLLPIWRDSRSDAAADSSDPPPAWVRIEEVSTVDDAVAADALESIAALVAALPEKARGGAIGKGLADIVDFGSESLATLQSGRTLDMALMQERVKSGILHNRALGMTTYSKAAIIPDAIVHVDTILAWMRGKITVSAVSASIAECELARRMDSVVNELLVQSGGATFDSITRAVGRSLSFDTLGDILYRLDGRIDHLLLDEFQDTSLSQWRALQPLAQSIAAGGENPRSILAVGDPKQSIYGWRSGDPRLLRGFHRLLYEGATATVIDESLATSWRSSPVILKAVDCVFRSLEQPSHPLHRITEKNYDENFGLAVNDWMAGYANHVAAPEHAHQKGCVRCVEAERGEYLADAARLAVELWRRSRGKLSIAVMARDNKDVGEIVHAIRSHTDAPPCSLLAGGALATSPAVVALTDALRFAAHPDDLISLLSVMQSPLASVWGLRLPDQWQLGEHRLARAAASRALRARFAEDSIACTLAKWVSLLDQTSTGTPIDDGDRRRISRMLFEIEKAQSSGAELDELIASLDACKLQDVPAESIHAINIHQAKGLEWDIVIYAAASKMPSASQGMAVSRGGDYRGPDHDRICERVNKLAATANVAEVIGSANRFEFQEFLSTLYVAITRAKRGLWIVASDPSGKAVKPGDPKPPFEIKRSHGGILWHALASRAPDGDPLDDESWIEEESGKVGAGVSLAVTAPPMPIKPRTPRVHLQGARSASALGEFAVVDVDGASGQFDLADNREALARGSIAHAVCETIEWIDGWKPDRGELLARARQIAPFLGEEELETILESVINQVQHSMVAQLLSKPDGPAVAVRERQFLHLAEGGALRQGAIDRLVLHGHPGAWERIEIVDFKTDSQPATAGEQWIAGRADHHRPQLEAYRDAVAAEYSTDPARISISIVLLSAGEVVVL